MRRLPWVAPDGAVCSDSVPATMNIGINFYMRGSEREGIAWSITHLLRHMLDLGSCHTFTLFTNLGAESVRAEFGNPANLDVVSFRMHNYTAWEQVGVPMALVGRNVDVFHSPLALPLFCRPAGIMTIHDLCFLTHRATFTRRMWLYFRIFLPLSVRRARIVLTVSQTSRQALIDLMHVGPEKIRVIPNGIAEDFQPPKDQAELCRVRTRYGLPSSFILYVGTLEPRKNVLRLLRACQRLWSAGEMPHKLVIAGRRGWLFRDVLDFVRESRLHEHVVFTGYVAPGDLPALYAMATVLVYPSLCEGFGLPPLEAMACGTPVVGSNRPALPEILGQAARLVDPLDVETLAGAIQAVVGDDRLRATLRTKGLEHARRYRWETSARQTLELYAELARRAT
jgi:glycosyltransferase involved in cell wall biosynthesis